MLRKPLLGIAPSVVPHIKMRKITYILILIFGINLTLHAQNIENCVQLENVFKYISSEKNQSDFFKVRKIKFSVNPKIRTSKGIPFLIDKYYSYKLGLTPDKLNSADTTLRNSIFRENQKKLLEKDTNYIVKCFKDRKVKNPNIYLAFNRIDSLTLSVVTSRLYKSNRHTFGKYYIFIFTSDNEIKKVFKTNWIE